MQGFIVVAQAQGETVGKAPRFPRLAAFLDHWRREVEAVIHSIRVASGEPLAPPAVRRVDALIRMH